MKEPLVKSLKKDRQTVEHRNMHINRDTLYPDHEDHDPNLNPMEDKVRKGLQDLDQLTLKDNKTY